MNTKALKARDRGSFPLFRAFSPYFFWNGIHLGRWPRANTFRAFGADIRSFHTGSTASGSVPLSFKALRSLTTPFLCKSTITAFDFSPPPE
jgi:hypothetical protein